MIHIKEPDQHGVKTSSFVDFHQHISSHLFFVIRKAYLVAYKNVLQGCQSRLEAYYVLTEAYDDEQSLHMFFKQTPQTGRLHAMHTVLVRFRPQPLLTLQRTLLSSFSDKRF